MKKPKGLQDAGQGIKANFWVWAAKLNAKPKMRESAHPFWPSVKRIAESSKSIESGNLSPQPQQDKEISDLLIQNPGMSAATFFNLVKTMGYKILKDEFADVKSAAIEKERQAKAAIEANSASANAPVLRAQESMRFSSQMLESSASDNGVGITKFKVALLTEGLGNMVDGFYYTKECIESAVPIFEGKKIYANHPKLSEEQDRPERDVNDIIGHFENCRVETMPDGRSQLIADSNILPDKDFEKYRALMRHQVEFAKKYPDKDFIGLSINANGFNTPMRLSEFISQSVIPKGAMLKLKEAMEKGLELVKVVTAFKDAVSCDLVTEAGAGGKILGMLEGEKSNGKQRPKKRA